MARGKSSNGKGVLVDVWHWTYKGVEADLSTHLRGRSATAETDDPLGEAPEQAPLLVKDQKVEIQLRLLKQFDQTDSAPASVRSVELAASNDTLGIYVQGTDIEVIRTAVWAKLEAEYRITWEEFLLVEIDREARYYRGRSEGFSLTTVTVWKGTARDGTQLLRELDTSRTSGPYKYRAWPGVYEDRNGRVVACIPATDANCDAMEQFRARIVELRTRLEDMVRPEVIFETLAGLAKSTLLPAPSDAALNARRAEA